MLEKTIQKPLLSLAYIAVNRFGYGARDNELAQAKENPLKWLQSSLKTPVFNDDLPNSEDILRQYAFYIQQKKKAKQENKVIDNSITTPDMKTKYHARNALLSLSSDTVKQAINSTQSVSWRLLDFFSNHFSVTAKGRLMTGLAGTLERESIAPNLLGQFEDLLLAVEQHPAMLIYLNNERSFGANSALNTKRKKGKTQKKKGLNENLAREILELHTLGVNGPYQQNDVTELANAITGWSVINFKKEHGSGFTFRQSGHEPGERTLLGKKYKNNGLLQGQQILKDLAINPATAKYLCYKLAHHFVSEKPPKSLLLKMEATWKITNGNIKQVMLTLFEAQESWFDSPQKFKTPREFVISTHRALGTTKINDKALFNALSVLGQQPFNAGSPAGYSDKKTDWLGGSALMARIDWTTKISSYRNRINAEKTMELALDEGVGEHTYKAVIRAESRQQALTLLVMSPEFQRR